MAQGIDIRSLEGRSHNVVLGDCRLRIGPLRIKHLAQLQRIVTERRIDPVGAIVERMNDVPESTRRVLAEKLFERITSSAAASAEEIRQFLGTWRGFATILWLCVAEGKDERPDVEDVVRCVENLPLEEATDMVFEAAKGMGITLGN